MRFKTFFFSIIILLVCGCNGLRWANSSVAVSKNTALEISTHTLSYRSSGFRYVAVKGDDWWVNRLVVNDSIVDVTSEERESQRNNGLWVKSCAWLEVKRKEGTLTVCVDAEKKMKFDEEYFQIDIQNKDTSVALSGTLGGLLAGRGEDISPSVRYVVFGRDGGKVCIPLKGGEMSSVTVDGKNPPGWPWVRHNLNDYTLDWLSVYCIPNETLELKATENLTEKSRSFILVLSCFNSGAVIRGIQQAAVDIPPSDTIGFSPSKVHFPLEGGTVEVMARTDGWVLDEKSYGLDWLTIEQDSNRLRLTATPNFDYDLRYFTLRFKKGDYYEYLEGEQETRR